MSLKTYNLFTTALKLMAHIGALHTPTQSATPSRKNRHRDATERQMTEFSGAKLMRKAYKGQIGHSQPR